MPDHEPRDGEAPDQVPQAAQAKAGEPEVVEAEAVEAEAVEPDAGAVEAVKPGADEPEVGEAEAEEIRDEELEAQARREREALEALEDLKTLEALGVYRPLPPRRPVRAYAVHLGLFLATCVTTCFAGLLFAGPPAPDFLMGMEGLEQRGLDLANWWRGGIFAATLLGILLTHEMGHYVAARIHRVDVSLPYFIPVPFGLGTFGAVISMRERIRSPNALMDIGAAGPLAGLAVALPLLVFGLWLSPVETLPPDHVGTTEGNSVLYLVLKLAMFGEVLPGGGRDVILHPVAWAAWVGLLVTMLNLIPVGQFDGGHVAFAFFGPRYDRASRLVLRLLPVVGACVFTYVFFDALGRAEPLPEAIDRASLVIASPSEFPAFQEIAVPWRNRPLDAASQAFSSALPWLVWSLLIFGLRIGRHPPFDPLPLSPGRRRVGILLFVVFLLIFMPIPLRVG